MVLLLEDDPAIIRVMDQMPERYRDKVSYTLPPSSSVQELYTTVMDGCDYSPDSCTLLVTNEYTVRFISFVSIQSLLNLIYLPVCTV